MRRRRPRGQRLFRNPFRRPGPRQAPPELRRANDLMERGEYQEAAIAFERIATQAERRRGPRAPIFFLRAGRAHCMAGNATQGMPHLKKGLGIIAARRDWEPLQRFGQRAVNELNELGFRQEAQEIDDYIASVLPGGKQTPAPMQQEDKHPSLPTHCPGCGAPVRADEVNWIDAQTAECIYCDSPVRAED